METIGIRELKEQATAIVRRVREDGTSFEVTYRGKVVARLVPVRQPTVDGSIQEFLQEWSTLAEQIGRAWPAGVSAVEAVRDVRREL